MYVGFVIGLFIFFLITFIIFCAMTNLFIFHARITYIGMTTNSYLESRNARGPLLWAINRKEVPLFLIDVFSIAKC